MRTTIVITVIENAIIPKIIPIGIVTENMKHMYAIVPILSFRYPKSELELIG